MRVLRGVVRNGAPLALTALAVGCEAAADPPMPLPRAATISLDDALAESADAGEPLDAAAPPSEAL